MSIADLLILLLVACWGIWGIQGQFNQRQTFAPREMRFLQGLYAFHLFVSLFFSYYIRNNGGDALAYWFITPRFSLNVDWFSYFRSGTSFILFLTYPLVKYLHVGFYAGGLLFALIGFQGFMYLHIIVRKFIKKPVRLWGLMIFPYILYMPNLHFWSSGIGKDGLSLYAIMLYFFSLCQLRRLWPCGILALALVYQIRPHIALFLLVSSFLGILIDGRMKLSLKLFLGLLVLGSSFFLIGRVAAFMKLDDVNTESISQYSSTKASKLTKGSGSAVEIAGYPFPLKVFTFLYRPLFFDARNALALVSSMENMVLLLLSIYLLWLKPFKAFQAAPMPIKAMFIFSGISACAFAMTLSNLGIMLRQKNPVIFCLLIFIFWSYAYRENLKNKIKIQA